MALEAVVWEAARARGTSHGKGRRMRRVLLLVMVLPGLLMVSGASLEDAAAVPPPGDIDNVEYLGNIPMSGLTSLNVTRYGNREVLFAVGRFGLKSFDLRDPERPELLDEIVSDELRLEGDTTGTFWQSESTNIDQRRKVAYLSRDPRAFGKPQDQGIAGIYIIDVRDPEDLRLRLFHEIPAGHTTTCINDCRYLWSGGPAPRADQPEEWVGRPIFVTDVRNPNRPYTFPDPVDIGRTDGVTDYSHDVQVDNTGVAWVSGRGGIRGYWTDGRHHDPLTGRVRNASAWDPIPYAGGGLENPYTLSGAVHNSERPIDTSRDARRNGAGTVDHERPFRPDADDGADLEASGYAPGELLYATDEAFSTCEASGKFYISSLEGSYDGAGWRSTPEDPFRLETVGVWSPYDKEGSNPNTNSCSAHYFKMKDGVVAGSWYGQGTRFLDVTDPTDPIQIAYYRPDGGSSFYPVWYEDLVYVGDSARGIDVIRPDLGAERASAMRAEVLAPPLSDAAAIADTAGFSPDPVYGWSCRLPTDVLTVGA